MPPQSESGCTSVLTDSSSQSWWTADCFGNEREDATAESDVAVWAIAGEAGRAGETSRPKATPTVVRNFRMLTELLSWSFRPGNALR